MTQTELFFPPVAVAPEPAPPMVSTPRMHSSERAPVVARFMREPEVEAGVDVIAGYTVRLVDYPHPAADAVRVAEQRFRRELQRQLGDDVPNALRAFQDASESSESDLGPSDLALARRWAKAYESARTAGLRELGDADEAFFDVRPV